MRTVLTTAAFLLCAIGTGAFAQVPGDPAFATKQAKALSQLSLEQGWKTTPSGLRYRKISGEAVSEEHPALSDTILIHYVGRLADGTEFDSSIARGEPARFPLGQLIKGWQEGVPLMRVGETFEFAIPHSLGYGEKGGGSIPGGATLFFTIELLGIGDEPTK